MVPSQSEERSAVQKFDSEQTLARYDVHIPRCHSPQGHVETHHDKILIGKALIAFIVLGHLSQRPPLPTHTLFFFFPKQQQESEASIPFELHCKPPGEIYTSQWFR